MSDFLGNLVARTIAQPTLRPRTRLRFEAPVIEEAPLFWPEATHVEESQPEPAVERARPGSSAVAPLKGGERPAVSLEAFRPAPHSSVATPAAPATAASGVVPPSRSGETPDRGGPDSRLPIVETKRHVVRMPRARRHRFDEQPPRIIERHEPGEIEEVHHHGRVIRTKTIDRRQRVVEKPQPPEPAAKPEPVIQVSIGRIEVRAVPPAPPARTAPRSATMTIDDYAAKRKAKERR